MPDVQAVPCRSLSLWAMVTIFVVLLTPRGLNADNDQDGIVADYVAALASDKFAERQEATRELIKIGAPAVPAVARALGSDDREVAVRATRILLRMTVAKNLETRTSVFEALHRLKVEGDPATAKQTERVLSVLQAQTVAAIQATGGKVEEVRVGKKVVGRRVTLYGLQNSQRSLFYLRRILDLREVVLSGSSVGDGILLGLDPHPAIVRLDVRYTQIGDAGLLHLKRFSNLADLMLSGTAVTDAGLAHLRHLEALTTLSLTRCQITNDGLRHVSELRGLEDLRLTGTQVSDNGLEHVAKLTGLRSLSLGRLAVTDTGLAKLRSLTELQILDLTGTRITNASVAELRRLQKLKRLHLSGTAVTRDSVAELKRHLTGCRIKL